MRNMVAAAVLAAAAVAPAAARQDSPKPVVLAAATPMTAADVAPRLTGTWKLNDELSPVPRAGSSPSAGPVTSRGGRGRGGVPGALTQGQIEDLRVRALYRELTLAPQKLTITASLASATFVDEDGTERVVAINSRKNRLDLGTSVVDSKAYWDGAALTIELDAGSQLKLFEIFELAPTGRQILVTLKTAEGSNPKAGQLRAYVRRVYDRID